jgi:hypothetical protein
MMTFSFGSNRLLIAYGPHRSQSLLRALITSFPVCSGLTHPISKNAGVVHPDLQVSAKGFAERIVSISPSEVCLAIVSFPT